MSDQILLRFHEEKLTQPSDDLRNIEKVARESKAQVMPVYPPDLSKIPRGTPLGFPQEPVLIVGGAAVSILTALSPIIIAWLKAKAANSVHIKAGDIEVTLNGTDDIEKAVETLQQIQATSGPKKKEDESGA